MKSFCNFIRWYYNKEVEAKLENMRKTIDFLTIKTSRHVEIGLKSSQFSQQFSPFFHRCCFFKFCKKDKKYDNYIRNWLKRHQQDRIQNGSTMKRQKISIQRGTGEATSNSRWCASLNRLIAILKYKPSSHKRRKRSSVSFYLMGYVKIAT